LSKGLSEATIKSLDPILKLKGDNESMLASLKQILEKSTVGMTGISETKEIIQQVKSLGLKTPVDIDITLARGLNYYTGAIIEVKVDDSRSTFMSSICGGGRYDDLTGIFGLPGVSGVGISFGADRIYDVLDEVNGFPEFGEMSTKILFVNFGTAEAAHCMKLAASLRSHGIHSEVYPDEAKIKKQMSYADSKKIPFVALIGSDEMKQNTITVKNMNDREQFTCTIDELLLKIS
jgi:histidyl-tRNA synthetase